MGIAIFFKGRKRGRRLNLSFTKPRGVVCAESVAVSVAEQRGTVVDFVRDFVRRAESLEFGNQHEPAAECVLIGGRVETEKVRSAVGEAVVGVSRGLGMISRGVFRLWRGCGVRGIRRLAVRGRTGTEESQESPETEENDCGAWLRHVRDGAKVESVHSAPEQCTNYAMGKLDAIAENSMYPAEVTVSRERRACPAAHAEPRTTKSW